MRGVLGVLCARPVNEKKVRATVMKNGLSCCCSHRRGDQEQRAGAMASVRRRAARPTSSASTAATKECMPSDGASIDHSGRPSRPAGEPSVRVRGGGAASPIWESLAVQGSDPHSFYIQTPHGSWIYLEGKKAAFLLCRSTTWSFDIKGN